MRCANPPPTYVKVIKTEEKGSDVNLAVQLVADGFKNVFDQAVIVSNDSDLVEAIKIVRYELGKPVIAIMPIVKGAKNFGRGKPSYDISNIASAIRYVRESNLKHSQFPVNFSDSFGQISKPKEW